jgi:2-polyprenyl-6-methoxyphenol hydroxylase-like FAD-dependent oxidoreductase
VVADPAHGAAALRIGIAGAGIGGLAAAALLARAGHEVRLFDQFAAPRPVGSGLVIQPVGLAVLDALGAGAAARAAGARIGRMLGHEAGGRRVLDVSYARVGRESFGLALHRAALFDALMRAAVAAGAVVTPSARVLAAPAGAARWLDTEAGRFGPFDLVVDAAGARSPLSPLQARPLPYGAVWGTVPWPAGSALPPDRLTQRYRRADRMAGVLPIGRIGDSGPLAAVFWSLPRARAEAWASVDFPAWKAEAAAFWPDFAPFLEGLRGAADMNVALYAHGTLARPWAERLVHLGDAAHRASPQLGQGANMALLDAQALARALACHGPDEAPAAYAAMRRWHVRMYQAFSAAFTPQYQSDSRLLPVLRDRLLFPLSQLPPAPWLLNRLVCGDLIPPLAGQTFPPDAGTTGL